MIIQYPRPFLSYFGSVNVRRPSTTVKVFQISWKITVLYRRDIFMFDFSGNVHFS